ncbi:Pentatricopeptide repeat-containing protein [Acorus calamus]|uniref:Pentatricopeptide repeat-containing protein n=1 Tax=Acorus calamus TaxID=4465 RepID=A0AAV9FG73_ACOCL|nr:Pentatricopeptide repeat-containing protein [Acorus calamus]
MPERDLTSWNTMISDMSNNGDPLLSLVFLNQMVGFGVRSDRATILSVLPACADMASLKHGKEIHGYVIRCGLEFDGFVRNSLIEMYSRCRFMTGARHLFEKMVVRDKPPSEVPSLDVVKADVELASSFCSNTTPQTIKLKNTHAVSSCLTLLYSINLCSITTTEGLGSQRDGFHSIQFTKDFRDSMPLNVNSAHPAYACLFFQLSSMLQNPKGLTHLVVFPRSRHLRLRSLLRGIYVDALDIDPFYMLVKASLQTLIWRI